MARADLELVPIVDDDGALVGVVTERALARRYIRESRDDLDARRTRRPTSNAVVDVLEGELVVRRGQQLAGRVWVHSMDARPRAGSPTATWSSSATAPTRSGWRSSSARRCSSLSNGSTPAERGARAGARARHAR